jgi:flavin reductase (DIM6/NTAB) family NADH-FMN oxidoreductase RutF
MMGTKVKIENIPFGPFPVVLAGADVKGKPNYATIGACGVVCQEPVLFISLKDSHYTTAGVRNSGYFSVNIPSSDLVRKTDYCGIATGKKTDKSKVFTSFYDQAGKAPMIVECPLNFLCQVIRSVKINGFEMFFGDIVASFADARCLTDGNPDTKKIDPMLITSGGKYWTIGRPAGAIFKEGKRRARRKERGPI